MVTLADVRDLFELRLLLEPAAVEFAARRASDEDLEAPHQLAHKTYIRDAARAHEIVVAQIGESRARVLESLVTITGRAADGVVLADTAPRKPR